MGDLRGFVGFSCRDEEWLRALAPMARAEVDELLQRFHTQLSQASSPGELLDADTWAKQSQRLQEWVLLIVEGPYDADFGLRSAAIGRTHLELGLPQEYMPAAMSLLRTWMSDLCFRMHSDHTEDQLGCSRAVHKMLDIQLALIQSAYRDHLVTRLQAQERLATIGELAAGIHHELKNPLAAVTASLFALEDRRSVRADPKTRALIDRVRENVERASEIVKDLLSIARLRSPDRVNQRVEEVIENAIVRVRIPQGSRLSLDLDPDLPPVFIDASQIQQVLVNLIENAFQACGGAGGRVLISSRLWEGQVRVVVKDNGVGIEPGDLLRVFEPLFSTKPEGVGLGLSLGRQLASANRALLELDSEPGVGTSASLIFRS